jgi:hypothetical protein
LHLSIYLLFIIFTAGEGFPLELWVLRHGNDPLMYNSTIGNPQLEQNKAYVVLFIEGISFIVYYLFMSLGIAQTYVQSDRLKNGFITSDVNFIGDPSIANSSRDNGVIFNFTVYFVPGSLTQHKDAWDELMRIIPANRYEIGQSDLFISPYQNDPFGSCFTNNCDKVGYLLVSLFWFNDNYLLIFS